MPSKTGALLRAIDGHPQANPDITKNELRVHDDDGNVIAAIYATPEELQLHQSGYPVSVSEGTSPKSLEGFSDEQLLAELRRRLSDRSAVSEDPPSS